MGKTAMGTTASPFYFGPADQACFGWLHRPTGARRTDLGLVICSPTGHEDQSAYRSLRHLAERVAEAGIAVLRFDYLGTGDSAGEAGEHDHPGAWRRSVEQAIEALRQHGGVTRICLLGMRLGMFPAAELAATRTDVCALVALAPVLRGRGFLREALMRSPRPPQTPHEGFELGGHRIGEQARAELDALDLRTLDRPPAARVLLVGEADLPAYASWAARLEAQGAAVDGWTAPELASTLDADVRVPRSALAKIAAWIAGLPGGPVDPDPWAGPRPRPAAPLPTALRTGGTLETPLSLALPGGPLFGVLTLPASGAARRAVVLLNTGSARRIGPSRLHVEWARQWARAGVAVLRLDLPGLGDSGTQPGEQEGEPYLIETGAAVDAALAALRERCGAIECTLVGMCSGAYHAWRSALAGAPVHALVLINQATYRWSHAMRVERPSTALRLSARVSDRRAAARDLQDDAGDPLKWQLLGGAFTALGWARDAARVLGLALPGDVGAGLRSLARRGIALHVVHAEHDPAGPLLDLHAGRSVAMLERRGQLERTIVAGADHIFTEASARHRLTATLTRIVTTPSRGPAARPSAAARLGVPTATS